MKTRQQKKRKQWMKRLIRLKVGYLKSWIYGKCKWDWSAKHLDPVSLSYEADVIFWELLSHSHHSFLSHSCLAISPLMLVSCQSIIIVLYVSLRNASQHWNVLHGSSLLFRSLREVGHCFCFLGIRQRFDLFSQTSCSDAPSFPPSVFFSCFSSFLCSCTTALFSSWWFITDTSR